MSWIVEWIRRIGKGSHKLGSQGERAAADHLKRAGYKIIAMNTRLPAGEIDLIAEAPDGKTIVVVEVKTSAWTGPTETPPESHVNRAKERKLAVLASQAVKKFGWRNRPVRFDVIGVILAEGRPPLIRHHPAAFESYF